MVVCVIDQAGYGATAAAPVVRDIYGYLAAHPISRGSRAAAGLGDAQADPRAAAGRPTAGSTTTTTTRPARPG